MDGPRRRDGGWGTTAYLLVVAGVALSCFSLFFGIIASAIGGSSPLLLLAGFCSLGATIVLMA